MSIELLESVKEKAQSSNIDNARLSYGDACILDSQNVDEKTQEVIMQYTSNCDDINSYERARFHSSFLDNGEKDKSTYENSAQAEERHNVLMEYLTTGRLPLDLCLFRGTSLENFCDVIAFSQIESSDFLNDCKSINDGNKLTDKYKGQVFTYGQPVPTSVKFDVACDFLAYPTQCMLKIKAPKGILARCIQKMSTHQEEKEVLLPPGTRFQIVKIRPQANGIKEIYVQVIVEEVVKNSYEISNEY